MAPWLSEQWVEDVEATASSLPSLPDVNATVTLGIAVARKKEVRLSWRYVDGVPSPDNGATVGADLELSLSAQDALDLFSGRVEPSVSFMRGRLKASGDGSLLLGFLAGTASERFAGWRQQAFELADPGSKPAFSS